LGKAAHLAAPFGVQPAAKRAGIRHKTTRHEKQRFSLDGRPEIGEALGYQLRVSAGLDRMYGPPSWRAFAFLGFESPQKVGVTTRTNHPSHAQDAVTSDSRRANHDSALNDLVVVIQMALTRRARNFAPLALSAGFSNKEIFD
jgi:hypothetical protein